MYKCPSCSFSGEEQFDNCPQCGLIIEKYLERQRKLDTTASILNNNMHEDTTTVNKTNSRKIKNLIIVTVLIIAIIPVMVLIEFFYINNKTKDLLIDDYIEFVKLLNPDNLITTTLINNNKVKRSETILRIKSIDAIFWQSTISKIVTLLNLENEYADTLLYLSIDRHYAKRDLYVLANTTDITDIDAFNKALAEIHRLISNRGIPGTMGYMGVPSASLEAFLDLAKISERYEEMSLKNNEFLNKIKLTQQRLTMPIVRVIPKRDNLVSIDKVIENNRKEVDAILHFKEAAHKQ